MFQKLMLKAQFNYLGYDKSHLTYEGDKYILNNTERYRKMLSDTMRQTLMRNTQKKFYKVMEISSLLHRKIYICPVEILGNQISFFYTRLQYTPTRLESIRSYDNKKVIKCTTDYGNKKHGAYKQGWKHLFMRVSPERCYEELEGDRA